jgi:phosphate transport system substrate-binding protein
VLAGAAISPAVSVPAHAAVSLVGAGSTFDYPFFDSAFKAYAGQKGVSVNYQPVGSGAGIQQFTQKLVDFGATDVPMNPLTELPAAVKAGGPVEQIPIALGGVSIAYNIPGVKSGLHLDGSVLADIFLGTVKTWNDKSIRALNKNVKLPSLTITVVHRSDSSGTSYAFTDYLSKVNDTWRGQIGASKTPNWPTGVGGKGNLGVAQLVQQTSGAIGYVELAYVLQNKMKEVALENESKQFVTPTLSTVAAAANSFKNVSAEHFSITNGKGKTVYPIATYSWVLLYRHQADATKGKALVALMKWLVTTAQTKYGKPLDYVPLPKNAQTVGLTDLKAVK